ncbi:hypothetical protein LCGC14_0967580 [marine sediment metagenome]|uniref:Uncharacterized protein n=1 Tax=marine sediment metagenome TaxID=412755 RepID=A0A0F9NH64_9ZZZZ
MTEKEQVMQAVARGWCQDKNSGKTMDSDLAMAITEEVLAIGPDRPFLGLATTGMLLGELKARAEVDGSIDYRTVGGG